VNLGNREKTRPVIAPRIPHLTGLGLVPALSLRVGDAEKLALVTQRMTDTDA